MSSLSQCNIIHNIIIWNKYIYTGTVYEIFNILLSVFNCV